MQQEKTQVVIITDPKKMALLKERQSQEDVISDKVSSEIGRPQSGSLSRLQEEDDYIIRLQALGVSRDALILELASVALSRDGDLYPISKILENSRIAGAPIPDYEKTLDRIKSEEKQKSGGMKVTVSSKVSAITALLGKIK